MKVYLIDNKGAGNPINRQKGQTMDELRNRYFDFVDELDPYRDTEDDKDLTLEGMLYGLLAMKEDADAWKDDDPELYEVLEATIEQFKAAGIEAI
jgi:hypothetical protein